MNVKPTVLFIDATHLCPQLHTTVYDVCLTEGCMSVPLMLWISLNICFVGVAAILVAYGEVSI